MAQAQRKVLFFKINTKEHDIEKQSYQFESVCEKIMCVNPTERMHEIGQAGPTEYLRLHMFEQRTAQSDFYSGIFVKYRTNNITVGNEDKDELSEFQLKEGLRPTEITHFIYSPATKILSIEYNHNGPKHMNLLYYVNVMQAKHDMEVIYFVPEVLSHPNVIEEIREADYIKSIELAIPRSEIPNSSKQNDWIKALLAASNIGNPGTVSVKISGSKRRGDRTPLMSSDQLATQLENKDIDLGIFGTAKVEAAMSYGSETINLLQNKIDSTISVPTTKTIEQEDEFFDAIRTVYTANKELLLKASEVEDSE